MIGRMLVLGVTLLTLVVGVGLGVWMELDSRSGERVLVPVRMVHSNGDLVHYAYMGVVVLPDIPEHPSFMSLDLDADRTVIGGQISEERPGDGRPYLRVRPANWEGGVLFPNATRLPGDQHDSIAYAVVDVSAGGTGYLVGLADERRQLLGRGDRAW